MREANGQQNRGRTREELRYLWTHRGGVNLWREVRQEFVLDIQKLLSNLTQMSLYLKTIEAQSRKETARKFLNNLNGWLYRRKFSQKKLNIDKAHGFLYEGLLFPFRPEKDCSSNLVGLA